MSTKHDQKKGANRNERKILWGEKMAGGKGKIYLSLTSTTTKEKDRGTNDAPEGGTHWQPKPEEGGATQDGSLCKIGPSVRGGKELVGGTGLRKKNDPTFIGGPGRIDLDG